MLNGKEGPLRAKLPVKYGNWKLVYRCYADWCDRGVWPRLIAYMQAESDSVRRAAGQHGRERGARAQKQRDRANPRLQPGR